MRDQSEIVICDANVLIDFAECGSVLIGALPRLFNKVFVPYLVMFEVQNISEQELIALGIEMLETPIEAPQNKGLTIEDWACFLAVQEKKCACITNDRKLRSVIQKAGYKAFWGLETLMKMCEARILSKAQTKRFGIRICERNPYITDDVKNAFLKMLSVHP